MIKEINTIINIIIYIYIELKTKCLWYISILRKSWIVYDYIVSLSRARVLDTPISAIWENTRGIDARKSRRLQRGASFIVAFPAVYRDSLANGKRHNGGHDGTKSRPCRYRPRNVVAQGCRDKETPVAEARGRQGLDESIGENEEWRNETGKKEKRIGTVCRLPSRDILFAERIRPFWKGSLRDNWDTEEFLSNFFIYSQRHSMLDISSISKYCSYVFDNII